MKLQLLLWYLIVKVMIIWWWINSRIFRQLWFRRRATFSWHRSCRKWSAGMFQKLLLLFLLIHVSFFSHVTFGVSSLFWVEKAVVIIIQFWNTLTLYYFLATFGFFFNFTAWETVKLRWSVVAITQMVRGCNNIKNSVPEKAGK